MAHFPHRAGNYILFAELGAGTFGSSYIGRAVGSARGMFKPLALRILDPQLSARTDLIRQFLDEQRAAALLQHPRIAALQEVGVMPDGSYFLACEYVHGVPLREVLRAAGGQLTAAQSVHIAMQLCDALHYAHERLDLSAKPLKIIHGQLTPDAVIIGFDGNAKIIEFGLLRTRDSATATIPTALQRRTAFMAPELRAQLPLRGAPTGLDRRVDVYSVGALLWEMLTGETLVPREDGAPPPSPATVDAALDAIVLKTLARDANDRYTTAQTLRLALSSVAANLSIEGSGTVAMGLARSLTMTFRGRMTAFQEQVDVWRKFEDDAMPGAPNSGTQSSITNLEPGRGATSVNMRRGGSGTMSGIQGANSGYAPQGGTMGGAGHTTGNNRAVSGILPAAGHSTGGARPSSYSSPNPSGTGLPGGKLFLGLLALALTGILVGIVLLLRGHTPEADGALMVDSQPRGAEIRIDGRTVGKTPHRVTELKQPQVRIEVRKEGYRAWFRTVAPQPGKTLPVEAELEPEPEGG